MFMSLTTISLCSSMYLAPLAPPQLINANPRSFSRSMLTKHSHAVQISSCVKSFACDSNSTIITMSYVPYLSRRGGNVLGGCSIYSRRQYGAATRGLLGADQVGETD